ARAGITGHLICDEGWFAQILEGPETAVKDLVGRIARDPRHSEMTVLSERRLLADRTFPRWSMAMTRWSPEVRPIFRRHGFPGILSPALLTPERLISLIADLQQIEACHADVSVGEIGWRLIPQVSDCHEPPMRAQD
ncbi:BLUF domain-containing protein, partial [Nostoc sp. NIES-2111]